jgi:hypothetical protein
VVGRRGVGWLGQNQRLKRGREERRKREGEVSPLMVLTLEKRGKERGRDGRERANANELHVPKLGKVKCTHAHLFLAVRSG